MQIRIGDKIRQLRRRDGRKQEDLANALGVTNQAVSRWEANGGYPDLEIIPAIANYFGITIDELFGYNNSREEKIRTILDAVNSTEYRTRGDDDWVDGCLSLLREGLAEFPRNEQLLSTLADVLSEAGWRRHREWLYYDDEGFIQHDYDTHQKNEYWSEAVKICESLADHGTDSTVIAKAVSLLVLLCRNFGENDKAVSYAMRMPELKNCREIMLAAASDGKAEAARIGDFLLKAAREFAEQLVYGLIVSKKHFDSDMPIEKIKGAIGIFNLICDDGNLGIYHRDLVNLYLYLSRIQWERGYRDDAFRSLDEALKNARALDSLTPHSEHAFTAPLVSFAKCRTESTGDAAKSLPDDWPVWCNPDYSCAEKEIKSDPRWNEWVRKTKDASPAASC